MALSMNLEKAQASLKLCLNKSGITTPPVVDLAFILDVSGSFEDEHRAGVTNDLMTRLVPWGMTFDPDKKLDVITFSDGERSVHEVGAVTANNYQDYVANKIYDRVPGWCGATDYSYAIEKALKAFGWLEENTVTKKAGFFGKMLGEKDVTSTTRRDRKRSLVIFVTDGDNYDKRRTEEVLRASEARGDQVYFLFLGISNQGSTFPFLEKIGDMFKNTGFAKISNLREFVQKGDDEVNAFLLQPELLEWLAKT